MKYLHGNVLKRIFQHSNIGSKALYLNTVNCINTFSTHTVQYNRRNQLLSDKEGFSCLSLARNITKAEELIPIIIREIEAEPHFFKCVQEICDDLSHVFPSAEVTLFGSARSNLALRNADADIELHFKERRKMSEAEINSVKIKLRKSQLFASVNAIFARVPIIKCVHCNGVPCDISFGYHLGTYDSKLTRFILDVDDRIRPLILILKFLLKREGLLVNAHSLVVMTVFFLQGLENPLLPPVSHLQRVATEREMFEGWDVSFTRDVAKLPKTDNALSVVDLLQRFFQFYSQFEFAFHVVSAFTGRHYLKTIFSHADLVPDEFRLYKRKVSEDESFRFNCSSHMCVQGFFNHSANITANFTQKKVEEFQNYCRRNAALGRELLRGDHPGEEARLQFLIKLFEPDKTLSKSAKESVRDVVVVMQNVSLDDVDSSPDDIRKKWWNRVLDDVVEILRDVVYGEVSISSRKREKESGDVVEESIISCEMQYWELATKLRKEVSKEMKIAKDLRPIDREKMISDAARRTVLKTAEKSRYRFDLVCELRKNPTRVRLRFEPKFGNDKRDGFLFQACCYLSKNMAKWLAHN